MRFGTQLSLVLVFALAASFALIGADAPAEAADDSTGSALTAKEAKNLVAYHNKVRKEVGVGPVKWSKTLAKFAQEWASHLAESGKFEHRPSTGKYAQKYGENLAINSTVRKGAEAWYSEKKDYKPGTPIPKDSSSFKPGHYTQMVWRKTTEIGAGKAKMKKGSFKGQILLDCNYTPRGNFIGEKPY